MFFYGASAMLSLAACCYLLFRRGNAIASEVSSPVRLRRWTAAFFASFFLSHLWYMPIIYSTSSEDVMQYFLIGGLLDSITLFPLAFVIPSVMLQDRRRSLWPAVVLVAPPVAILTWCVANHSASMLPVLYRYLLLFGIVLIIYMVRAVRQYGRWLRDNYADLEHKEVWQSFVVMAVILFAFGFYALSSDGLVYEIILQLHSIVLVCYLLWRVETLSDLSVQKVSVAEDTPLSDTGAVALSDAEGTPLTGAEDASRPDAEDTPLSAAKVTAPQDLITLKPNNLTMLLQQKCIDRQLYLQHDLTLQQLARAIGTNRSYLSQYLSSQGMTYHLYINNLRIQHFISLYDDAIANHRTFTLQQLAHASGYHSYSTFSLAFKQRMGQSVTAWMRETANKRGEL